MCDICNLVDEATEFENHLVSDRHIMNRTTGLKNKIRCETCNKDINEKFSENHS